MKFIEKQTGKCLVMEQPKPNQRLQSPPSCFQQKSGFTLIELLVVIGIIGVLASLLFPTLHRGKEEAQKARCLSNLHQLGIGIQMWVDDHGHYPPDRIPKEEAERTGLRDFSNLPLTHTLGGRDPAANHFNVHFPPAILRPLNDYVPPSEVYRCGADKGQGIGLCMDYPNLKRKPSNWLTLGSSYIYNAGPFGHLAGGGLRLEPDEPSTIGLKKGPHWLGPLSGIAGKREGWVRRPDKHILMHEPPARMEAST